MSSEDEAFLSRLHDAALRARASGFDGVADAIEEILRRELARRAAEDGVAHPDTSEDAAEKRGE